MNVPLLPPTPLSPFRRARRPADFRRGTIARADAPAGESRPSADESSSSSSSRRHVCMCVQRVRLCAFGNTGSWSAPVDLGNTLPRVVPPPRAKMAECRRLQMLGHYNVLIVVTAFLLCEVTRARRPRETAAGGELDRHSAADNGLEKSRSNAAGDTRRRVSAPHERPLWRKRIVR